MYNFFTRPRIAGGFLLRKDSFASQPHRKLSRLKSKAKKIPLLSVSERRGISCIHINTVPSDSFGSGDLYHPAPGILCCKRSGHCRDLAVIAEVILIENDLRAIRILKALFRLKGHSQIAGADHTV